MLKTLHWPRDGDVSYQVTKKGVVFEHVLSGMEENSSSETFIARTRGDAKHCMKDN